MLGNDRVEIYRAIYQWKGAHLTPDERLKLDRLLNTMERKS